MKRLFSIAAIVAVSLAFASPTLAASDLMPVDDPVGMSQTHDLITGLIAQDTVDQTFERFRVAVDVRISPLCRDTIVNAGFCAALADNKSMATTTSGPFSCPAGTEPVPPKSRNCVEIPDV